MRSALTLENRHFPAADREPIARSFLRGVAQLWRCALPVVVAGMLGGIVDEWHHLGVSNWISLCLATPLPLATAAYFQSQLLACSYLAMLGIVMLQWVGAFSGFVRHPKGALLLGQGCCALAMLLALVICPRVLAVGSTGTADLLAMASTDLLCAAAGVLLGAALLALWRNRTRGTAIRAVA